MRDFELPPLDSVRERGTGFGEPTSGGGGLELVVGVIGAVAGVSVEAVVGVVGVREASVGIIREKGRRG